MFNYLLIFDAVQTTAAPPKLVLRALADLLVLFEPIQQRLWESYRVSVAQLRVLRVLSEQQAPLAAGQLAALAGVSQASLSRLLAKLEQRGLVGREVDPADRRRVSVTITPEGGSLLQQSRVWRGTEFDRAAAQLSPAERQALIDAIGGFVEHVRAAGSGG